MLPAVRAGDETAVAALLRADPDAAFAGLGNSRVPPLFLAAKHGHAGVARLLLPFLSRSQAGEWDPLSCAARRGHVDCVAALREHGVPVCQERLSKHAVHGLLDLAVLDELVKYPDVFFDADVISSFLRADRWESTRPRTRVLLRHLGDPRRREHYASAAMFGPYGDWAVAEGVRVLGPTLLSDFHWVGVVKRDWVEAVRAANFALPADAVAECRSLEMLQALEGFNRAALSRPLGQVRVPHIGITPRPLLATLWARTGRRHGTTSVLVRPLLEMLTPAEREETLAKALPPALLGWGLRGPDAAKAPLAVAVTQVGLFGQEAIDATALEAVLDLTDSPRDDHLVRRALRSILQGAGCRACSAPAVRAVGVLELLLAHPTCPPVSLDELHFVARSPVSLAPEDWRWEAFATCLRARRTAPLSASSCSLADLQAALRKAGCPKHVRDLVPGFGAWPRRGPLVLLRALVEQGRASSSSPPSSSSSSSFLVVRVVERAPARPWRVIMRFV